MENWSLPLGRREVVQGDPPGGFVLGSPWSSGVGTSTSLSNTEITVLPYVCACVLGPFSPV